MLAEVRNLVMRFKNSQRHLWEKNRKFKTKKKISEGSQIIN